MLYYTRRVYCTNCKHNSDLQIPKGKLAEEALKGAKCPNCEVLDSLILM